MVPVIDEVGLVVAMCVIGCGRVGGCVGRVDGRVGHADLDCDTNNGRVGHVRHVDGRVGHADLDGYTNNGRVGCG